MKQKGAIYLQVHNEELERIFSLYLCVYWSSHPVDQIAQLAISLNEGCKISKGIKWIGVNQDTIEFRLTLVVSLRDASPGAESVQECHHPQPRPPAAGAASRGQTHPLPPPPSWWTTMTPRSTPT